MHESHHSRGTRIQSVLLDNLYKMRIVFDKEKADKLSKEDAALIEEIADHISAIKSNVDDMVDARKTANKLEDARDKAVAYTTRWRSTSMSSATMWINWN